MLIFADIEQRLFNKNLPTQATVHIAALLVRHSSFVCVRIATVRKVMH